MMSTLLHVYPGRGRACRRRGGQQLTSLLHVCLFTTHTDLFTTRIRHQLTSLPHVSPGSGRTCRRRGGQQFTSLPHVYVSLPHVLTFLLHASISQQLTFCLHVLRVSVSPPHVPTSLLHVSISQQLTASLHVSISHQSLYHTNIQGGSAGGDGLDGGGSAPSALASPPQPCVIHRTAHLPKPLTGWNARGAGRARVCRQLGVSS